MTEGKNDHIYWTGASFLEIFDFYITFLKEFSFWNFWLIINFFPKVRIILKNKINTGWLTFEIKTKEHSSKGAHSWFRNKPGRSLGQLRKGLEQSDAGDLVCSQAKTKAIALSPAKGLFFVLFLLLCSPSLQNSLPYFLVESHKCVLNIDWIFPESPCPGAIRVELYTPKLGYKLKITFHLSLWEETRNEQIWD